MRVISGLNRGTKLYGYDIDGVRPTMDKVKESVFAMINNYIDGSVCLDLFSGTGSLGIEALSNGASTVYFVDNNNESIDITKKNIDKTHNNDKSIVIYNDYINAIKNINTKFDIIFVDPPYGKILITDIIKNILKYDILNNNGIVVCEYEKEDIDTSLELFKERKYGSTLIRIYRR